MTASSASVAFTELSGQERRSLGKKHPEIAGRKSALVLASDDPEDLALIQRLIEAFAIRNQQMRRLIEAMLPDLDIPSEAAILQARRNAAAREALLEEFGALSSAQVAERAGSKATNRAALANRWRKEGRILGVIHRGQTCFPAFQFDADGRPLPAIAAALEAFAGQGSDWETALWFVAANGWLGGARPVDLLAKDPDKVADAARREATELVF